MKNSWPFWHLQYQSWILFNTLLFFNHQERKKQTLFLNQRTFIFPNISSFQFGQGKLNSFNIFFEISTWPNNIRIIQKSFQCICHTIWQHEKFHNPIELFNTLWNNNYSNRLFKRIYVLSLNTQHQIKDHFLFFYDSSSKRTIIYFIDN